MTDIGALPISRLEMEASEIISIIFVEVWGSNNFCAIPTYFCADFTMFSTSSTFISKHLQHIIIFNMYDEVLQTKSGDWTSLCEDLRQKTVKMNNTRIIQELLIPKTLMGVSDTTEGCSQRVNTPIQNWGNWAPTETFKKWKMRFGLRVKDKWEGLKRADGHAGANSR